MASDADKINAAFCKHLLRSVTADVKRRFPEVNLRDAWVYKMGREYEFHYRAFYWYGQAENASEARANGWMAWLESQGGES